jgi:hypothetical protein
VDAADLLAVTLDPTIVMADGAYLYESGTTFCPSFSFIWDVSSRWRAGYWMNASFSKNQL